MKRAFLIVFSFFLLIPAQAQKIKYKDLFVFLSNRQYDLAEPLLKRYLKDTDDNPNAFMYMGYIYEEKFLAADVLREQNKVALFGDSAAYFLDLANRNMTDKEIKKNDEYYQSFSRRNPRTGDFGVLLSDVVNHLTEKSKEIRERQQKVVKLNRYFSQANGIYGRLQKAFATLTSPYENIRQLYLRSNDSTILMLEELSERQDSLILSFNSYKSVLTQMGKSTYNQSVELMEIKDFTRDGRSATDFYGERLMIWDYNYWSQEAVKAIKKEIRPVLSKLVLIDTDLTSLRNRVAKDSVSVTQELLDIAQDLSTSSLLKYDSDPLPHAVLLSKISEINYGSVASVVREDRRSQDLNLKVTALKMEADALNRLDSITSAVMSRNLEQDYADYTSFVRDTYGSLLVVQSFLRTTNEFARSKKTELNEQIKFYSEAMNWIVDETDSIPAMEGVESPEFFPVFIQEEAFTTGVLHREDQSDVTGYFYTITKDRKPEIKATFPLDSTAFHYSKRALMDGTVLNSVMGMVYFSLIWSEERINNKIPIVISKIYTVDGLSWSNQFWLEGIPEDIRMIAQTGEITIKYTGAAGPQVMTITKDGKTL